MKNKQIEQKAFDYFNSGFNCAEAIYVSIVEAFADDGSNVNPKPASAFCGGIGKSTKEACGALTGGILALGELFGRSEANADFSDASELAGQFRDRFVQQFKSSRCMNVLEHLGEQENMLACKKLTGEAAGILKNLIQERARNNVKTVA